jgi:hypothetical protein
MALFCIQAPPGARRAPISVIGLAIALLAPAAASARIIPIIPPGNSGANQYVEVVPTANGGRPSNNVHLGGSGGSGSSGGSGGGQTAVARSTGQALAQQGEVGLQAAALARATAPPGTRGLPTTPFHQAVNGSSPPAAGQSGGGTAPHRSAAAEVLAALTGSTGAGLGPLLPAILLITLVSVAAVTIRRLGRRRQ